MPPIANAGESGVELVKPLEKVSPLAGRSSEPKGELLGTAEGWIVQKKRPLCNVPSLEIC